VQPPLRREKNACARNNKGRSLIIESFMEPFGTSMDVAKRSRARFHPVPFDLNSANMRSLRSRIGPKEVSA
jgi:hypothetical protein